MIPAIDAAFVDAAAPNADAAKNGRGLVTGGKFASAKISSIHAQQFTDSPWLKK